MVQSIIWSDAAIEDFEYIVNYYEFYSILYAKKIVTTTFKVLDYIAHNPQIGTASNIKQIKNKAILNGYSLVYKVKKVGTLKHEEPKTMLDNLNKILIY